MLNEMQNAVVEADAAEALEAAQQALAEATGARTAATQAGAEATMALQRVQERTMQGQQLASEVSQVAESLERTRREKDVIAISLGKFEGTMDGSVARLDGSISEVRQQCSLALQGVRQELAEAAAAAPAADAETALAARQRLEVVQKLRTLENLVAELRAQVSLRRRCHYTRSLPVIP